MSQQALSARIASYRKVLMDEGIQSSDQDTVSINQKLRTPFAKIDRGELTITLVLHGCCYCAYPDLQHDYSQDKS